MVMGSEVPDGALALSRQLKDPRAAALIGQLPKNRTPSIRVCGMGLGPGLSRTHSSELDKLGWRSLRC